MSGKKIEDIDINFRKKGIDGKDLNFIDALNEPFAMHGFPWHEKGERLCRLPESVLPDTNEGVQHLAYCTSGGMMRFKTDSDIIALRAELFEPSDMPHMTRTGSSGFDLYIGSGTGKKFKKALHPEAGKTEVEAIMAENLSREMRECTIYMPLYSGVKQVLIGLNPDAKLEKPASFTFEKPILFYGSSITQGGCASRPGNSYTHIIARWLDANLVNLGFSGSGRGEPVIAESIGSIDLCAFVMDYDHNAPTIEHLEKTHEKFFRIIREKQPVLPIVIASKCDFDHECPKANVTRREIIRKTYENALDKGDKNVYFVDGETLFGEKERDACTVDGCHPNDLGFMRMAKNMYPAIQKALKLQK